MPTILIVDDDIQIREFLVRCLMKHEKHNLLTAVNGRQALEVFHEANPDLVIIDWEMPEMNGLQTVRALKSPPRNSDIPIIMCTGVMTDSVNLTAAFGAGVIDFIRKPVDETELLARVSAMLKFHELQKARLRVELEKHELELHYRQQELSNYILQLTQKNEFLNKLKLHLSDVMDLPEQKDTVRNQLQQAISSIDFNINNDSWSDLARIVNSADPGFTDRMQKKYPDLTTNEIRLCVLIRLKLNTKEIAQILNITVDSITKSRYRIKKKIAQDSEMSLDEILMES